MTAPTSTKHALRLLLDDVAHDPELSVRVKQLIANLPTPVPAGYLVDLSEMSAGGQLMPKRQLVEDKPEGEHLERSTELYAGVSHIDKNSVDGLVKAARDVISYIEAAHRPPVHDEIEFGRMALVRLHALADLRKALLAFEDLPQAPAVVAPVSEQSKACDKTKTYGFDEFNQAVRDAAMPGRAGTGGELLDAINGGMQILIDMKCDPDHSVTIIPPVNK
jgi:hypothetical protein